jgi:hypothetical protein
VVAAIEVKHFDSAAVTAEHQPVPVIVSYIIIVGLPRCHGIGRDRHGDVDRGRTCGTRLDGRIPWSRRT